MSLTFPDRELALRVQLFLGGTWVDMGPVHYVTPGGDDFFTDEYTDESIGLPDIPGVDVRRLPDQEISISRGRSDEVASSDPAQVSFVLWNDDGRLTPGLWNDANGEPNPWCPEWGLDCQVRILVGSAVRFLGTVSEIHPEWPFGDLSTDDASPILDGNDQPILDGAGNVVLDGGTELVDPGYSQVTVVASGVLRRLGLRSTPLRSSLYREISSPDRLPHITHYWPMEDGSGSQWFGSGIPGDTSRVEFDGFIPGGNTLQPGSAPLPAAGQNVASYLAFTPGAPDGKWGVECWVTLPDLENVGETLTILNIATTGSVARWVIDLYQNNFETILRIAMYSPTGGLLDNFVQDFNEINDRAARIRLVARNDDSGLIWSMIYNLSEAGPTQHGGGTTIPGQTCGAVTSISGFGQAEGWSIGHLVVHDGMANGWTAGADSGWFDEAAQDRIGKICNEEHIPFAFVGGDLGTSSRLGVQPVAPLLDILEEARLADGGRLTEQVTRVGLHYRARKYRYNLDPVVTLDAHRSEIANPFLPTTDDQQFRNDVTVERTNGTTARVTVPQLDQASPLFVNGWPVYAEQTSLNLAFDKDVLHHAGWLLHLGEFDGKRYPQVTVDLTLVDADLRTKFVALREGDQIRIINLPPQHPSWPSVDLVVEGWTETLSPYRWMVTFNCAPAEPWQVARHVESRYHARRSVLAETTNETYGELEVDTTGGLEWTEDPAHFPFHALVGPELVKVTSISPSSPGQRQTFFVTRNVNGIARAHVAGTEIQPCRVDDVIPDRSILAL